MKIKHLFFLLPLFIFSCSNDNCDCLIGKWRLVEICLLKAGGCPPIYVLGYSEFTENYYKVYREGSLQDKHRFTCQDEFSCEQGVPFNIEIHFDDSQIFSCEINVDTLYMIDGDSIQYRLRRLEE
jgi:hypothetical protein